MGGQQLFGFSFFLYFFFIRGIKDSLAGVRRGMVDEASEIGQDQIRGGASGFYGN